MRIVGGTETDISEECAITEPEVYNFAKLPLTKVEKDINAGNLSPFDWEVRDMLIYMLRQIDLGKLAPNKMLAIFSQVDNGAIVESTYCSVIKTKFEIGGLLDYLNRFFGE